ncbi:Protein FAR1-RELATED SEQUENCE 9, partial [Cucurbita argyrosperma subsp. sororia]
MSGGRQRTLGVGIQHILDDLKRMQAENPAFYYAVQGDGDHSGFFQEPAIVFASGLYSEKHRQQAADPYSRRIFRKFQEELVETLANPTTKIDDTGAVARVKSIHIHNVAMDMDALKEASRKVAAVKNRGPRASNGDIMANGVVDQWLQQKRIRNRRRRKFMILEKINQRCEVYRANLLAVLRDVEEQKLNLSVMKGTVEGSRVSTVVMKHHEHLAFKAAFGRR